MTKKALLIIDMQKGSFTPKTPRYDTNGVVKKINDLTDTFRAKGYPVIFIQHDGSGGNEFIPNTESWALLDDLTTQKTDIFIDKYANDVFYNSKLKITLDKLNINQLYITGCATDFCIEATVQSALSKDYNITVVKDGHTTGDRPHLSAKQVITHYNWVWQNMIPTKGTIKVEDFYTINASL
ncbi:cysteine hydrolase family protein [Tamlana sp. 2201CG12-4]|uniref:cysteine hydrolase family protein n=1 Tax=Tamlana sp. 2201CG12-4 TaxID=3112582 RepID=UPI002DB75460|nr:cysteine hydrolase family protein [Tamlana sp. 2201CG12-4]MEC3908542.1 cysteine hydrolase family protein [Tamlana sp. 2201CG12-4]